MLISMLVNLYPKPLESQLGGQAAQPTTLQVFIKLGNVSILKIAMRAGYQNKLRHVRRCNNTACMILTSFVMFTDCF
jgi:hypothetical protein